MLALLLILFPISPGLICGWTVAAKYNFDWDWNNSVTKKGEPKISVTGHVGLWTHELVKSTCHMSYPMNLQSKWYSTLYTLRQHHYLSWQLQVYNNAPPNKALNYQLNNICKRVVSANKYKCNDFIEQNSKLLLHPVEICWEAQDERAWLSWNVQFMWLNINSILSLMDEKPVNQIFHWHSHHVCSFKTYWSIIRGGIVTNKDVDGITYSCAWIIACCICASRLTVLIRSVSFDQMHFCLILLWATDEVKA